MNILVIGNGFDLAHGLPTKYTDFIDFIKSFMDGYKNEENGTIDRLYYCSNIEINVFLKKMVRVIYENENGQSKEAALKIIGEFYNNIKDNFWIDYFLQCDMYENENWIDFESEISKVIQSLDNDMHRLSEVYSIEDEIFDLSNKFLNKRYLEHTYTARSINAMEDGHLQKGVAFKEIRDKLLDDLNRLIRALEIYLCEYVGKIKIQKKSPDIEALKFDKVLSFNYTDTFSKLYKAVTGAENDDAHFFDYIHGKADMSNTIESNNMVLGIDEYLSDDRKNKDVEFIAFKKYYQRIYKQTGCKYKEWVDGIKKDQKEAENHYKNFSYTQISFDEYRGIYKSHNLYIFGHSLDVTDKDILRDLILNDNVHTTIFYHDRDAMGRQIANLVKVIGQDELIRRTGGKDKLIEFKPQQAMIEREEQISM